MKNIHLKELNFLKALKEGFAATIYSTEWTDHVGRKYVANTTITADQILSSSAVTLEILEQYNVRNFAVTSIDIDGLYSHVCDDSKTELTELLVENPDDEITVHNLINLCVFLTHKNIDEVIDYIEFLSKKNDEHVIEDGASWFPNPYDMNVEITPLHVQIIEFLYVYN